MEKTYNNYFKILSTQSEEEKAIDAQISAEQKRFEATESYVEHRKILDDLFKKSSDAHNKRLKEAENERPKRVRWEASKPLPKQEDSEEVKAAIKVIEGLNAHDKKRLYFKCFSERIPFDERKKMKDEDIEQLHMILVQTVLDYIKEKGLKDVWSVSFSADSLQESAEYGEWCPSTDSYLGIETLNEDNYFVTEDGKKHEIPARAMIGESF